MGTHDDGAEDLFKMREYLRASHARVVARADRQLGGWLKTRVSPLSVANEASVRVLENPAQFRGLSDEAIWRKVRLIVDHLVIDHARKHRRTQRREAPFEAAANVAAAATSATRELARQQSAPLVLRRARAILPQTQLRAFTMRMQGRGFDEIAAELGVSEAAARRKCERAVSALGTSVSRRRPS